MAIKEVSYWQTSDGSTFTSREAAMDWERDWKLVAAITKFAQLGHWDFPLDAIRQLVRFLNANYAICPRKGDESTRA